MSPGASIPLSRTAVPVEWDDFRKQLEKLTDALQPTGRDGVNSVGEFINSAADNVRGQGDTARDTVIKLSAAISALGDHADDIFSTVRNLQLLVSALYSSSDLLASFNHQPGRRDDSAVQHTQRGRQRDPGPRRGGDRLTRFRRREPGSYGCHVRSARVRHDSPERQPRDIKQVLHVAPTVFQNFPNIYQPAQSAITGILAPVNFADIPSSGSAARYSRRRAGPPGNESSKLCYAVPGADHQEPPVQLPPLGINPFVGTSARPNEITYSEDWLRPESASGATATRPPPRSRSAAALGATDAAVAERHRSPTQGLAGPDAPGGHARETRAGRTLLSRLPAFPRFPHVGGGPELASPCPAPRERRRIRTPSRRSCQTSSPSSRTPGSGSPTSTSATSPRSSCKTGTPWSPCAINGDVQPAGQPHRHRRARPACSVPCTSNWRHPTTSRPVAN